ncbi:unnamed protein product [Brassica oleracea]|uniref:(rape) hypothetical protein n=1 Tax=Brassica napus TaxID=3708 RepID=A0A816LBD6_BRANA|nr:unnamed protein product [Brassica napus]
MVKILNDKLVAGLLLGWVPMGVVHCVGRVMGDESVEKTEEEKEEEDKEKEKEEESGELQKIEEESGDWRV